MVKHFTATAKGAEALAYGPQQEYNQSINQSNPVLLKERVRIPRTCRAGGAAML